MKEEEEEGSSLEELQEVNEWVSSDTMRMINRRNHAYKQHRLLPSPYTLERFRHLKKQVQRMIRKDKSARLIALNDPSAREKGDAGEEEEEEEVGPTISTNHSSKWAR